MISFLVVGDGYPAAKVAKAVASMPGARLAGFSSTLPPKNGKFTLPGGGDVEAAATELLRQDEGAAWVRRLGADWLLCINSSVILPARLIEVFGERSLNSHPGPLPEYAGLHAHQWAIRSGASEYGSTVHRMETRVDAGPIVASTWYPVLATDTGLSLYQTAVLDAANLLISVVARITAGQELSAVPQDLSRRRVYRHRDALDGRIDWRMPAREVVNFVRAGNYEPLRSPTYTATMRSPSEAPIEVLSCEIAGPTENLPGSLVRLEDARPVIACGDDTAVRILRARNEDGPMNAAQWSRHFG
jgi:methionyl-tRNA formyltransferase